MEVATPQETLNPRTRDVKNRSIHPPELSQLLELVGRFVKARRISLMEQFRDKDRYNHKRVTQTGFAQVLQLIGCQLSKREIDVLCGFYNDPATNFVDYTIFVEDINEVVGQIFGDRASTEIVANPIPSYGGTGDGYIVSRSISGPPNDWEEVKSKIQSFIFKRRIRIEEFFFAFDRLRSGKVTDQKFRSVIGQTDLPLSADEINFLIEQFRVPDTPDMFDYRTFCHQLNKVFGRKELEKKPVDKGKPPVQVHADPSARVQAVSPEEIAKIREIVEKMKKMVSARRMAIRAEFEDYDKAPRKNYITKQQFKQCLARLGLSTDPNEYACLCKRYKCTDLDDMNYHAFCDDIEAVQ
jgi:Ca2+-binding EF-hand superfamily protein